MSERLREDLRSGMSLSNAPEEIDGHGLLTGKVVLVTAAAGTGIGSAVARRALAEGLLRDENHSLAEIAFLTGFSEQSSFTRAFKRWVGTTPASYRKDRMRR